MAAQETKEILEALFSDSTGENYPYTDKFGQAVHAAIQTLEELEQYRALGTVEELKEAREKQVAKKLTHIHEKYEKHQWQKKKNGEVDDFAWGSGYCNGVVCERCGETICVHCNPNYDDEPCIVDKDLCPNCGKRVWSYEHKKYCSECGQAFEVG